LAVAGLALLCVAGVALSSWVQGAPVALDRMPAPLRAPFNGSVQSAVPGAPAAARVGARRRAARRLARPVRVEIPAIGVHARVIRLGLRYDRTLEVPSNFAETGWWSGGARPGERGPAVIVGHVDSTTGPAVFYRLPQLSRGDMIRIVRADGSAARFTVQSKQRVPKARFPTAKIYGRTRTPTLRLITCSGTFDRSSGHYLDNTIVFATAVGR
jgi:hypothetical protein